jgi:PEP-CTERM motif
MHLLGIYNMNNISKILAASSVLMATVSFNSQAVVVDGIDLGDPGPIALQDVSRETVVTQVGNTLIGVGHITAINNDFGFADIGEELNFTYTANVTFDNGGVIIFNAGATLQFWIDAAGTYTNALKTATPTAAQNLITTGGLDFLDFTSLAVKTIAPYNVTGAPTTGGFFGGGSNLDGSNPNGHGVGYFDVTPGGSGAANNLIATQALTYNDGTKNIPYDFLFSSTFTVPGTKPTMLPVQDASTFTADITEPASLALLGLGLFAVSSLSRKSRAV